MKTSPAAFLCLPFLALASCGGGGGGGGGAPVGPAPGPGAGRIVLEATDAPVDPRLIESATIDVYKIRIHEEVDCESGFVTLYDGPPLTVELTALRNGLTRFLSSGVLEAGTYTQLRLHVSDAHLRLTNGKEYSTEERTIKLTCLDSSGFKIFLEPPVVIEEGVDTRVLLDFDLSKSFSPVGRDCDDDDEDGHDDDGDDDDGHDDDDDCDDDCDDARFFKLHPVVRAAVISQTGELRGAVTIRQNGVRPVPASHAPVFVVLPGETDPDCAVASTLSDENGSAAILGVQPGRYDVLSVVGDQEGRKNGVVIGKGDVVPFEILVE